MYGRNTSRLYGQWTFDGTNLDWKPILVILLYQYRLVNAVDLQSTQCWAYQRIERCKVKVNLIQHLLITANLLLWKTLIMGVQRGIGRLLGRCQFHVLRKIDVEKRCVHIRSMQQRRKKQHKCPKKKLKVKQ